jgi:hypothetical protein
MVCARDRQLAHELRTHLLSEVVTAPREVAAVLLQQRDLLCNVPAAGVRGAARVQGF